MAKELLYIILDDCFKRIYILEKYNHKFHAKYHLNKMIIPDAISFCLNLWYYLLVDDTKNVSKGKELEFIWSEIRPRN